MVENSDIHKQVQLALADGDVTRAVSLVEDTDVDVDHRDVTHDLQTLLMKLCYMDIDLSSLQPLLEALFNKDPDVNIQDSWGRTFLMHACIANKPYILEAILGYENTDVTIIDYDGNSALSYAVQNCDLYTLEDLLRHEQGPSLLSIKNSKGQSPYTIAEKSGNKDIMQMFEPYIRKSNEIRQKRTRKLKHHGAIQLPPAYVSTPRDVIGSPRLKDRGPLERNKEPVYDARFQEDQKGRLQLAKIKFSLETPRSISYDGDTKVKCESAPVMRTKNVWPERAEFMTSLSLTSPRLSRRHHKQDCLLSETLSLSNRLPQVTSLKHSQGDVSEDLDILACNMRRQRRPSISLPDLRNVTGSLVSSENSTPTSENGRPFSKHFATSADGDSQEDDVFSLSYPNEVKLNSSQRRKGRIIDRQGTLPEIHTGITNMTSQSKSSIGISPLARQRKCSSSDDQLQRISLIQNRT